MSQIPSTHREWLDRMAAVEDECALTSIGIPAVENSSANILGGDIKGTITSPTVTDFFTGNLSRGVAPQDPNQPTN